MDKQFKELIHSEEELRTLIGFPSELVERKMITYLDHNCEEYISKSPFLVISSSDHSGNCDVSPRGDMAGFVKVEKDFSCNKSRTIEACEPTVFLLQKPKFILKR
ncbi:putative pyridoxine 5'-phosphate oxidase superfamily flavin-nucleotide-binding protein [Neobacillus niacini]|uniref:hypothetical protein n=1 Tax=Neobacillus driksii TaxID=3035913 RepID=UPI00278046B5|nr:hypothetical protein [Neobacillus niacini]MDQ0970799.1 putative pyridoxine 5'-phosphate oxidase superfamily flavin-nucleotide-binding protein [Neobacillus niacini]